MTVAKIDENGRATIIAASSSNGTDVVASVANPTTHRLHVTRTTVGDNGNNSGNAMIDANGRSVITALSSNNDGSIIEIYANPSTGAILIR